MLQKVVQQKTPYIVDGVLSIQEFLMSDQLIVDVLQLIYIKLTIMCTVA